MRKVFSILLLILFYGSIGAQDTTIVRLNHVPSEGIVLNKGWKFQADDNSSYAQPQFDDSKWQRINPTLDILDLPQGHKTGICWLRLHLVIDSILLREQLALIITQSVASEIYLNGQLLYKFGTLSANLKQIKAYDPTGMYFSFPFRNECRTR
jgi:hypothetical protein